jgi:glycosyltransferase involved in cell wall biosynthesis/GT2 family glycosyltransferase/ADP-heptose:LPS heptosyltransferase
VLIRCTPAIGDALYLTAIVANIRRQYPHLSIYIAGDERGEWVFRHHPDINAFVPLGSTEELLIEGKTDFTLEYNNVLDRMLEYHNRLEFFDIFANIAGIKLRYRDLIYTVESQEAAWADNEGKKFDYPGLKIGLHFYTDKDIKRSYPHGRNLLDLLHRQYPEAQFILFGTDPLLDSPLPYLIDCAIQKIPFRQQVALAFHCDAFITIDSAFFHIGHNLCRKPTLLIAGLTNPRLIGNPAAGFMQVQHSQLDCLSCYWQRKCNTECMNDLPPESIGTAFFKMMASPKTACFQWQPPLPQQNVYLPEKRHYLEIIKQEILKIDKPIKLILHDPYKTLPAYAGYWNGVSMPIDSTSEISKLEEKGEKLEEAMSYIPSNYEIISCPFCQSTEANKFRSRGDIVECGKCKIIYLRTRLKREAMAILYQSYADGESHMALPQTDEQIKKSALRREYFMQELIELIKPQGTLLDIGCGWGGFLTNAQEKGYQARGIEITKKCLEFAKARLGLPVTSSQFTDTHFEPNSIAVVTMLHSLEHLPDPRAALEKIYQILEPNGVFCGIVPNIESFCSQIEGDLWDWLDPAYHYIHFSPETLKAILQQVGFIVEKIYTASDDYGVKNQFKLIKDIYKLDSNEEISACLKSLEERGQGEAIRFFARKPGKNNNQDIKVVDTSKLNIIWEGPQFLYHSLAHVNRELCLQLINRGHQLSILADKSGKVGLEQDSRFAPLDARIDAKLSGLADIHVRHWFPPDFTPPPAGHWVMIQPWEMGSIPQQWIEAMGNQVDELWVPSSFVRDCYLKSGLPYDRVFVVPNGVNTDQFNPQAEPLKLSTQKTFKFLYVGATTLDRKGFDILINAYVNKFHRSDDVCLVIKDMAIYTGGRNPLVEQIKVLQTKPGVPEIIFWEKDISPDKMPGLYTACDCLVHPYRGEGFGLPIAEAMACGLPVIVPGYGACLDFCNDENAYLIPVKEVRLPEKRVLGLETVDAPWWCEPDGEALMRTMRQVMEHPQEALAKGRAASNFIRQNFTWEQAAATVEERLVVRRQQPIRRFTTLAAAPRPVALPGRPAVQFPVPPVSPPSPSQETQPMHQREGKAAILGGAAEKLRVLVIAPVLPTFDRDSGSFRLFQILRLLRQAGHEVTFIAQAGAGGIDPQPYVEALQELGISVFPHDPEKLHERAGVKLNLPNLNLQEILTRHHYDTAYLYKSFIALQYMEDILNYSPHTCIVVDSVDLQFLREQRLAELSGDPEITKKCNRNKKIELTAYQLADVVITITQTEKQKLLQLIPEIKIDVVPNIHPVLSAVAPFKSRHDLLFVGGFLHHPNVDAMEHFCKNIWPLIASRLPDVKFYLVGDRPPDAIKSFASDRIIVTGFVPEIEPFLQKCRISIAPLRYGAGMKGKIGEAMSAGLPVISTSIGAEGMDLTIGKNVLLADNDQDFAEAVVRLYNDERLWNELSFNGRRFIQERFSPEAVAEQLYALIPGWSDKKSVPCSAAKSSLEVSIIIPVLNNLQLTQQCLQYIWENTLPGSFEVIVIDNGSNDGTDQFLRQEEKAGRIRLISNKENLGFAKASNQGAKIAQGEYLIFLNNDTKVQPGWLEELINCAQKDEDIAVVGAKLLYPDDTIQHAGVVFNDDKKVYHVYKNFAKDHPAVNKEREFQAVTAACMLIKRDIFFSVGLFNERYRNGLEDLDLCFKVREQGYKIVYNPQSVVYHYESKTPGRFEGEAANCQLFLSRWYNKIISDMRKYYQEDGITLEVLQKAANKRTLLFNDENKNVFWQEAIKAKVNGEYENSIQNYNKALNFNPYAPNKSIILEQLSDLFAFLNRNDEAEQNYQQLLLQKPTASNYLKLGIIQRKLKKYPEAISNLEKGKGLLLSKKSYSKKQPIDLRAWQHYQSGKQLKEQKEFSQAIEELTRAKKIICHG